jgi:glucosylceramidase
MLLKMSDKGKQVLLHLFDPVNGARFAYGRIPIGASDYARSRYTLNDSSGDYEMKSFSIKRDLEMLIPYIKAALEIQPSLRLWASAWTPPPWMKDNNNYDSGKMKSDAQTLNAYALYLALFVESYAKEGLKVEAVHIQNEPEELTNYPSCGWTPTLERDFVKVLGPLFGSRKVTAEIWAGTYSRATFAFPDTILSDSTAKTYIKGIGVQWGGLDMLGQIVAKYPSVPLMQTETPCGNNKDASFNADHPGNDWAYGDFTWGRINSYFKAGVSSYMSWNMVLDEKGWSIDSKVPWPQNALIVVNSSTFAETLTPAYYAFRHFSGFVDAGAKRIGTSGSFTGDVLAFKNPSGRHVVVLRNTKTQAQTATVNFGSSTISVSVPAQGWATIAE